MSGPDPGRARGLYRREADAYDRRLSRITRRYRHRAVTGLALKPGDSVLDVACGTGVNLGMLAGTIAPGGRVVGIDLSPEMLTVARMRVRREALTNVVLIEGAVGEAELPGPFDAALFSLTHDVLQSAPALEAIFAELPPGARVASFGGKRPSWGPWPIIRLIAGRYITTFEGYDRPWLHLEGFVSDLTVRPVILGAGYLAFGTVGERRPHPRSG